MKQCSNFKKCGGCQYLDMPYEEQLKKKHKEVSQLLKNFSVSTFAKTYFFAMHKKPSFTC